MTPAGELLTVAREYCRLIEDVEDVSRRDLVERLCALLPRLYAAGESLPRNIADGDFEGRMTQEEWSAVFARIADRLGDANFYWVVLEFFDHEKQEVAAGALADDLADIYRDLRAVLADPRGEAGAGDWRVEFETHWGAHAARALAPLHELRVGWGAAPAL